MCFRYTGLAGFATLYLGGPTHPTFIAMTRINL
jgi:hypothetical protein